MAAGVGLTKKHAPFSCVAFLVSSNQQQMECQRAARGGGSPTCAGLTSATVVGGADAGVDQRALCGTAAILLLNRWSDRRHSPVPAVPWEPDLA
jgi:hypothetical protein